MITTSEPLPAAHSSWLDRRFLDRLVATPQGRAFLLDFMADAEESDEAGVFDRLLARVDDEQVRRLVRIHRDDETRHAQMLRECVARTGVVPDALPLELRIVDRIDRELGGFAHRFTADQYGVMEAYVLLQVIEERAVRQFPAIERALRKVDPHTADVVARVTADERRHVGYARAISRRYAPDAATLAGTVRRFRAAEQRAFTAHGDDVLRVVLARGLLAVGGVERRLWQTLAGLARLRPGARAAVQPPCCST